MRVTKTNFWSKFSKQNKNGFFLHLLSEGWVVEPSFDESVVKVGLQCWLGEGLVLADPHVLG